MHLFHDIGNKWLPYREGHMISSPSYRSKHDLIKAAHTLAILPPVPDLKTAFRRWLTCKSMASSYQRIRWHLKPNCQQCLGGKKQHRQTTPDLVMKLNVIRGIWRCCTRGFALAEVVWTVGQYSDSNAWDYVVEYTLARFATLLCLHASCDPLWAYRNNWQPPQLYQITAWLGVTAEIRRLICSGANTCPVIQNCN